MKRVLVLVAAVLATAAGPVSASHSGYSGGCTLTPLANPGGQANLGTMTILATASPAGTAMTIDCWVVVNGVRVDVATASGVGGAADTETVEYAAGPFDLVEVCEHATVDGHAVPVTCHP